MSETRELDDLFAHMERLDRLAALIQELRERVDRRQDLPDVPLHQRGFGAMDEPPA